MLEAVTITLPASTDWISLSDLEEYVMYNLSIRAMTGVGPGPFSVPLIRATLEDSKTCYH